MALGIARIQETLEIWDKSKQNRIVINFSGVHIQPEQQSGFDLLFIIQYHFSCPVFMSISSFRLVHCQSTICEKGNVFVSCGVKFTYTVAATHSDKYDSRARTQAAGRHGGIRICFIFFFFSFRSYLYLVPWYFFTYIQLRQLTRINMIQGPGRRQAWGNLGFFFRQKHFFHFFSFSFRFAVVWILFSDIFSNSTIIIIQILRWLSSVYMLSTLTWQVVQKKSCAKGSLSESILHFFNIRFEHSVCIFFKSVIPPNSKIIVHHESEGYR